MPRGNLTDDAVCHDVFTIPNLFRKRRWHDAKGYAHMCNRASLLDGSPLPTGGDDDWYAFGLDRMCKVVGHGLSIDISVL